MKSLMVFVLGVVIGGLPLGWIAMEQAKQLELSGEAVSESISLMQETNKVIADANITFADFDAMITTLLPVDLQREVKFRKFRLPDGKILLNGPGELRICDKGVKKEDCGKEKTLKFSNGKYGLWLRLNAR